jgi:hypothetical protein
MKPGGGGAPSAALSDKLCAAFGSVDAFKAAFKDAALAQFGSGWAWLVAEGDTLKIVKTPNAMSPLVDGATPLLTCDVWEHAYCACCLCVMHLLPGACSCSLTRAPVPLAQTWTARTGAAVRLTLHACGHLLHVIVTRCAVAQISFRFSWTISFHGNSWRAT